MNDLFLHKKYMSGFDVKEIGLSFEKGLWNYNNGDLTTPVYTQGGNYDLQVGSTKSMIYEMSNITQQVSGINKIAFSSLYQRAQNYMGDYSSRTYDQVQINNLNGTTSPIDSNGAVILQLVYLKALQFADIYHTNKALDAYNYVFNNFKNKIPNSKSNYVNSQRDEIDTFEQLEQSQWISLLSFIILDEALQSTNQEAVDYGSGGINIIDLMQEFDYAINEYNNSAKNFSDGYYYDSSDGSYQPKNIGNIGDLVTALKTGYKNNYNSNYNYITGSLGLDQDKTGLKNSLMNLSEDGSWKSATSYKNISLDVLKVISGLSKAKNKVMGELGHSNFNINISPEDLAEYNDTINNTIDNSNPTAKSLYYWLYGGTATDKIGKYSLENLPPNVSQKVGMPPYMVDLRLVGSVVTAKIQWVINTVSRLV